MITLPQWMLVVSVFGSLVLGHGVDAPGQDKLPQMSVEALIDQLDAETFQYRESATQELIRRGQASIRPLAMELQSASPEQARRIKRCLELIGKDGNEGTFYRAIGIVQIVFGSSNEKLDEKITQMRKEWAVNRQLRVLKRVETLGGKITPPLTAEFEQRYRETNLQSNNITVRSSLKLKKRYTPEQQSELIETILSNSVDENRDLLFKITTAVRKSTAEDLAIRLMEERVQAQGLAGAFALPQLNVNAGHKVTIGPQWIGNRSQFGLLTDIPNLHTLAFERQTVDRGRLQGVERMKSLVSLEFDRCKIDERSLTVIRFPTTISRVAFKQQPIEVSLIDRITAAGEVDHLAFDDCRFSVAAWAKLFRTRSLSTLELAHCELDRDALDRIGKMSNLRNLTLDGCKFDINAYRSLVSKRPNLVIEFAPVAFLGVRNMNYDDTPQADGCPISEVIRGSAADAAGLEANDRLVAINKKRIEKFEDLRLHISQYNIGETIEIDVQRGDQKLTLTVKLGKPTPELTQ